MPFYKESQKWSYLYTSIQYSKFLKKMTLLSNLHFLKDTLTFKIAENPAIAEKNSCRGCVIIIWTGILLHISKTIAPRVKSQPRGQVYWSRALK